MKYVFHCLNITILVFPSFFLIETSKQCHFVTILHTRSASLNLERYSRKSRGSTRALNVFRNCSDGVSASTKCLATSWSEDDASATLLSSPQFSPSLHLMVPLIFNSAGVWKKSWFRIYFLTSHLHSKELHSYIDICWVLLICKYWISFIVQFFCDTKLGYQSHPNEPPKFVTLNGKQVQLRKSSLNISLFR